MWYISSFKIFVTLDLELKHKMYTHNHVINHMTTGCVICEQILPQLARAHSKRQYYQPIKPVAYSDIIAPHYLLYMSLRRVPTGLSPWQPSR